MKVKQHSFITVKLMMNHQELMNIGEPLEKTLCDVRYFHAKQCGFM